MNNTQRNEYTNFLLFSYSNSNYTVLNSSFLSKRERILGRIDPYNKIFFSYIKDIPHMSVHNQEFNKVIEVIDYVLIVNEQKYNYDDLLQLIKRMDLPIIFTSTPNNITLNKCVELHICYKILELRKTYEIKSPTINIYGIFGEIETDACVNLGLRIRSAFNNIGYSVEFITTYDSLKLLNWECNPDIIINLLPKMAHNENVTLYVADSHVENQKNITSFVKKITDSKSKIIIIHDYKKRIINKQIYYLNFYDSNLQELIYFIKEHNESLNNVDSYICLTKHLFLKNKKSIQLYEFEGDNYVLFSALGKTICLPKDDYIAIEKIFNENSDVKYAGLKYKDPKKLHALLEKINRFIVENNFEEENILFRLSLNPVFINNNIYTLSFVGNGVCNMNCKYCFSDHTSTQFKGENLSPEIMHKALELVCNKSPRPEQICVDFMIGSEPLTKFEDYIRLVEICRFYGEYKKIKIQLGFLTNGVQLNENLLKLFNQDLQWMGFSIDGDKKTHDSMRTLRNGKGSYDIIIRNARKILSSGWICPPGVSVVITSNNLNILQIFKHLWKVGFRVIIARPVRAEKEQYYSINAGNIHLLEKSYLSFSKFLLKKTRKHQLEYLKAILFDTDYFGRFLIRIIYNTRIFVKHCGAGESIWSIRNDGSIYSCDSLNAIGISHVGDVINGIKSKYVLDYVTQMDNCKLCHFRFLCGGPCNHLKHLDICGDVLDIECRLTKFLIKLSISFWKKAFIFLSEDEKEAILSYIAKCNNINEEFDDKGNFAYGPR
jgi:uncharacterized protein